jgi:hypothetical protein
MPPKDRVKQSVRLEPEAIAIVDAYAQANNMTKTDAINALILASQAVTHTQDKLPPIIATQNTLAQWQKDIETRLSSLEAATQQAPNCHPTDTQAATQDATLKPIQFTLRQEITGQHSKLYSILLGNVTAKQKIGKYWYYLFQDLGIICDATPSRANKKKFTVGAILEPGRTVKVNLDGTFMNTESLTWEYEPLETTHSQVDLPPTDATQDALEAPDKPVVDDEPVIDIEALPPTATQEATTVGATPDTAELEALSRAQFKDRYQLDDGKYGQAFKAALDKGYWVAPDDRAWKVAGRKDKAAWTQTTADSILVTA